MKRRASTESIFTLNQQTPGDLAGGGHTDMIPPRATKSVGTTSWTPTWVAQERHRDTKAFRWIRYQDTGQFH